MTERMEPELQNMEHLLRMQSFRCGIIRDSEQKRSWQHRAAYRTWYIKTVYNEQTGSYEAKLDAAYLTGQSDPLFTDKKTGAVILPAGTVVITEYQHQRGICCRDMDRVISK